MISPYFQSVARCISDFCQSEKVGVAGVIFIRVFYRLFWGGPAGGKRGYFTVSGWFFVCGHVFCFSGGAVGKGIRFSSKRSFLRKWFIPAPTPSHGVRGFFGFAASIPGTHEKGRCLFQNLFKIVEKLLFGVVNESKVSRRYAPSPTGEGGIR